MPMRTNTPNAPFKVPRSFGLPVTNRIFRHIDTKSARCHSLPIVDEAALPIITLEHQ
jgi:hypothetical protein